MKIRLNKFLRDKGYASRREADLLVKQGAVLVNGKPAKMGQLVGEKDRVEVKKEKMKRPEYFAYYKPAGLSTQANKGQESVVELVKRSGLFPIGRLDKNSEGLLLLTNDGRMTSKVLSLFLEKEYLVKVREPLKHLVVEEFRRGMTVEPFGKLKPAMAEVKSRNTLRVVLSEGKRHQIRVMLSALRFTIESLKRVRVGPVKLGTLRPSEMRPLTRKEVSGIFNS